MQEIITQLATRFGAPGVSLVLLGSHARGDAGPFSDVDLLRLLPAESHEASSQDGSYLVDGKLVVVSSVGPSALEAWFTRPEQAVNVIAGLRTGRVIAGPSNRY